MEKSFFARLIEIELKENPTLKKKEYCKCEDMGGESKVVCNFNSDVNNCAGTRQQMSGKDKTPDLLIKSRTVRSADRHDEEVDYFDTEFIYDGDFKGKVKLQTDNF